MKQAEIFKKIDIFRILDKLGIHGSLEGKELVCLCPLPEHEDHNPSFSIVVKGERTGLFRCFSCGGTGNIIHLIQRVKDIDRDGVQDWLALEFGFEKVIYSPSTQEISEMLDKQENQDIEEDMIQIPLPRMSKNKRVLIDYLVGVRSYDEKQAERVIDHFNIGYVEKGYYNGRLIVPICDSRGVQTAFEACSVVEGLKPKKLYPKGSPVGRLLFNQHRVEGEHVWVVEGIWDAIRLWSFGEPVVSTFGAKLTEYQSRILINKYQDIFLMFDGDEAGGLAMDKAKAVLSPYVDVYCVPLMFGDPAELYKREFREMIRFIRRES